MVSSIFEAVGNGDLNQLRKNIVFHQIIDDQWTDYQLLLASLNQDNKEIIKLLLNNGCRVQHSRKNHFMDSPLHRALSKQDEDILELLLSKVSLGSIDYKSESVFESVSKSSREKIKLILKAFVHQGINPADYDGFTPFHLACHVGDADLVRRFLDLDCDPDSCVHAYAKSFAGYSGLHFAVESRCAESVELLLGVCREVLVKDLTDKSAFYLACEQKLDDVVDLFVKAYSQRKIRCGADEGFSVLHKSLFDGDLAYCKRFSSSSWTSWSLLHFAVARQSERLVKFLLDDDDLLEAADQSGLTPLHLACQCSFKIFYRVLMQSESVYYDCQDVEDNEPVEILRMLLSRGSEANARDGHQRTPLFHALDAFRIVQPSSSISQITRSKLVQLRLQLVDALLSHGARIDLADLDGLTPLHQLSDSDAVFHERDKLRLAQRLLELGADVNSRTGKNVSPLFLAIRNKHLDLAKLYIDAGADVNCACTFYNRFTPLHALTYYNDYNYESVYLLRRLLQRGADVDAAETDQATALHIAIDCHGLGGNNIDERDEMAVALLEYGARVDAPDKHRQTALHRACLNRYDEGARVLLEHGADVGLEDDFGHTPLDYAGYRVRREASPAFFYTLRHHVHGLKFIGRRVSEKNEKCLLELERLYARQFKLARIERFLEQCAKEAREMRDVRLDNYTTLYDVLRKGPDDMARHARNEEFARIALAQRSEFKIYGYLLRLQYRRGLRRRELVEPAQLALRALSGCELLPDTSVKLVFEHLGDDDLERLIEAN